MKAAVEAIWHDVECGSYEADLALWEELAADADGPVLELGCGTGRVALHLARRGHETIGVDRDPELIEALRLRAALGCRCEPLLADAREFELEAPVATGAGADAAAADAARRGHRARPASRAVAAALAPGGRFAAAIVEEMPEADGALPPLPDVREVDGWVYSSLPIEAAIGEGELILSRLRQTVSPAGELSEERNEVRICTFPAAQLEAEGAAAGLRGAGTALRSRRPTIHVGSVVVVLERRAG